MRAPGNGFVLMRQQQAIAALKKVALIMRRFLQRPAMGCRILPLLFVPREMLAEGNAQRLKQIGNRAVFTLSERRGQRKFPCLAQIQLASKSDVATVGMLEFVIHL